MKLRLLVPATYLALAGYAWIDFLEAKRAALAGLWLMVVTLPVTLIGALVGWLLARPPPIFEATGLGYVWDHALYFWPNVLAIALGLYWVVGAISRRMGRRRPMTEARR
jgi:hypothetical protein